MVLNNILLRSSIVLMAYILNDCETVSLNEHLTDAFVTEWVYGHAT